MGRDIAVVFPGLPAGVTLRNPSGVTGADVPYVSMKPALSAGGLARGASSEPVRIEFDDPEQVLFALRPQVLAGTNHAPVLNPVAPLTVMPGSVLRKPLQATDVDGDLLAFSLTSFDALPTGMLTAAGVLEFRPAPDQLGDYQFDVMVSDGAQNARQTVTLHVVADPITTTRISGQVLQVDGQPLANMPVQVGAVQALTGADGSFLIDLGAGHATRSLVDQSDHRRVRRRGGRRGQHGRPEGRDGFGGRAEQQLALRGASAADASATE